MFYRRFEVGARLLAISTEKCLDDDGTVEQPKSGELTTGKKDTLFQRSITDYRTNAPVAKIDVNGKKSDDRTRLDAGRDKRCCHGQDGIRDGFD